MKVKLSYQTLHLPPPFAYAYTLDMKAKEGSLQVAFDHEYLHREQISTEEIMEEGFSENDNYSWQGELPHVWLEVVQQLLSETATTNQKPEDDFQETYLHLDIVDGQINSGFPENPGDWQYKMEELIQAIYEVSGREKAFYLCIHDQSKSSRVEIHASFVKRQLEVITKGSKRSKDWDFLGEVFLELENMSIPTDGNERMTKKGMWLTFDDQAYYKLNEAEARRLIERVLA